ncbi:DNA processing protein [Desulfitispora alkaliphila]|uniref:DNA-processing protein DprA n=1 Tax=Desulfitispora alkaliphila TaxID=622674 RepID=UPI003D24AFB9
MDIQGLWVAINSAPGIGTKRFKNLLDHFGSVQDIWMASREQLQQVNQIPTKVVDEFVYYRSKAKPSELLKKIDEAGIWFVTLQDALYPEILKHTYNPPVVIYGKGNIQCLQKKMIAVVGSRNCSYYAREMAAKISTDLAEYGYIVVSGLARGIDTYAHKGALKTGETVAVLGCGVDVVYPPENNNIYQKIIEKGAVISEYLPGQGPLPNNFPARNRIISGLAQGVLVVEAGEKSGALITADFALEEGRDVYALPGMVTNPAARGTNNLLKQGAKLVEGAQDIIEEYTESRNNGQNLKPDSFPQNISSTENKILDFISREPIHINNVANILKEDINVLSPILLNLELKGLIIQLPGKYYILA